ncbi:hypothetical protein RSOLAG22IIIB_01307 [Rhizoctonia solani]|uniref:DNA recombination and repair protein Rad51-like C-terminal domain-containing protein n=1 Tax=Rhizoctonia solani TaxID=456999 RepID=A0A0K6G5P4_9AGAM|nr:unnamed protein product [Rhizoctonia solani]CUA73790.1 hypothetical protein RSOLAG22IIIB_01307 [Rhizoctonia solani]
MSTQSKRSVASLQINPSHRTRLIKNGYSTVADIQAVSAEELSRDLGLSLEDANTIIAMTQPQSHVPLYDALASVGPSASQRTQITITGSQTAAALLKVPASATALSLGANAIDELLDGGAIRGALLEISGVPGSGRSAAIRSVIASAIKTGHEVLLADSRGDLPAESLRETTVLTRDSVTQPSAGLHHLRITSLPELLSFISTLSQYCADHSGVKLVALSQLSYHVQTSAIPPQARVKLLTYIKQQLTKTCGTGQVAIVATTSMAVKLIDDEGQPANFSTGTKALLVPTLGDGFSLASKTYRLILGRHPHDGQRFARLVTAPDRTSQSKTTNFMLKNGFMVGVET